MLLRQLSFTTKRVKICDVVPLELRPIALVPQLLCNKWEKCMILLSALLYCIDGLTKKIQKEGWSQFPDMGERGVSCDMGVPHMVPHGVPHGVGGLVDHWSQSSRGVT